MKKRSTAVRKRSPQKNASGAAAHSKSATASPTIESSSTRLEVISIPPAGSSEAPRISTSPELRSVRFGLFQPDAREVFVVGSFNGWNQRANPLQRDSLGDWSVRMELPPGEYHYRLIVDGEWRDDPSALQTALNPYGGFDAVIVV